MTTTPYCYETFRENAFLHQKNAKDTSNYHCFTRLGNGIDVPCALHSSWQEAYDALSKMVDDAYKAGASGCPTFFHRKLSEERAFKAHLTYGVHGYCHVGSETSIYPVHEPNMHLYVFNDKIIAAVLKKTQELGLTEAKLSEDGQRIEFNCPPLKTVATGWLW